MLYKVYFFFKSDKTSKREREEDYDELILLIKTDAKFLIDSLKIWTYTKRCIIRAYQVLLGIIRIYNKNTHMVWH